METKTLVRHWKFLQWPVVWAATALALALGIWGFALGASEEPTSVFDNVYQALQLFVLGGNTAGALPWQLEVARFLAPAVAAYTATQALIAVFHEQLSQLRLRFTHGHIVVCGLGRTGFAVARNYRRKGMDVVAIEKDLECDFVRPSQDFGTRVIIGSATDDALLREARVAQASALILACGEDGTNVEVAIRAGELVGASGRRPRSPLQCHVQIVDDDLRALFKTHRVFTGISDGVQVHLFNLYDASARFLLRQQPLDRERIAVDDPRHVHLIVVGFGHMGESLVLQAARHAHFANGRRLRVTVVDQAATERRLGFSLRYPSFDRVCDVAFVDLPADNPELYARVADWSVDPAALTTVAVCFDDDARGLSCALTLQPRLKPAGIPILIRMSTEGGLTTLVAGGAGQTPLAGLVRPFAILRVSAAPDLLAEEKDDSQARRIHEAYLSLYRQRGQTTADNPSLVAWEELDEDLKDANRQQAEHLAVKLRALGWASNAAARPTGERRLTSPEVEMLARMEHARWMAERMLAGWRHAPGAKDAGLKTSSYLVAWEDLPEEVRAIDRMAVRQLLETETGQHPG